VYETVEGKDRKYLNRISGPEAQACSKNHTEEETGLGCAVKTQIIRIDGCAGEKQFELYPREIRDDTGDNDPEKQIFIKNEAV
jgi:hypothetical protein